MTPAEKNKKYQEIWDLLQRAEQKLKETERLDGKLSMPSNNQLRYVGYH